jgi:hypothetical protein
MESHDRDPLTERIIGAPSRCIVGWGLACSRAPTMRPFVLSCSCMVSPSIERNDSPPCTRDVIVDGKVVVEIKSVARFEPVFLAQMLPYLRVTGIKVGPIVNFNCKQLRDGIRRVSL